MKHSSLLALSAIPATLFVLSPAFSSSLGIFPNTIVLNINTGSLTRTSAQSCGRCHRAPPGRVTVTVDPANRLIPAGSSTGIRISGTSTITSSSGGFVADVTQGAFTPGANTRTNASGSVITHSSPAARGWSFNWKAPSTPGLAELYTVVNTVNGDTHTTGDAWAFHASNPTSTLSTPVRLYSLPTGVRAVGESCPDGFGNYAVLGAPSVPSVGNSGFKLEGFGLPPSSPLLFMLSVGKATPGFDLAPAGAPGCVLYTSMQLQIGVASGPGNASRSEGVLTIPLPIPNQQTLRGLQFTVQYGVIDSNSKRPFSFTTTNGVEVTIQ